MHESIQLTKQVHAIKYISYVASVGGISVSISVNYDDKKLLYFASYFSPVSDSLVKSVLTLF